MGARGMIRDAGPVRHWRRSREPHLIAGKVAGAFDSQEGAVVVPHLQERAGLCPSREKGGSRARGSAKTLTYRESEEPVLELERSCPLIPGHQADAYD